MTRVPWAFVTAGLGGLVASQGIGWAVTRLVAQGDLRAMRITASPFGELRFTEGDIKAYIRRHRVKPDGRQAAS